MARKTASASENMTMKNRAVLGNYLALVGLPFLAVLGLLQLGDSLTAQPSVAGRWVLDADLNANRDTPCAVSLAGFQDNAVTITQSGKYLELSLPNRSRDRLRGTIDSPRILAEARPALFGDDVFDLIRVSGRFVREGDRLVLHGLLSMPRRIECSPVPFRATHIAQDRFSGSAH
jgi:hypothetical protein